MKPRFAPLACLLALISCAGPEGEPPSLGPRPVEGILDAPVYAIAPVPSADDPALAARIDGLVAQAEQGEQAFLAAYPAAQSAIAAASNAAVESEAWIEANLAISALGNAGSPTTTALGELDGIFAEQAASGEPAETARLAAARDRVATLHAGQAARYDALNGRLRTR
ncbi:hypothetical protein [Parasphingopyxis marina]|uniref:Lipoprotein n=1 Tax=Parasphingopyxis marina TaxID=2761622 RepID=A0A842HVF8_9SPHN|nr:hypothetical protein [Parasphingopyxis marina]MBC2778008.1 hypothetical protein [Parasphingopyxis marina]